MIAPLEQRKDNLLARVALNESEAVGSDSDQDADGVDNSVDNCPKISNSDQADGDEDGLGDVCDVDALIAQIPDLQLAACLSALKFSAVQEVQSLDCSNQGVANLEGLASFIDLQTLDLSNNQITDLSELVDLTRLKTLSVGYNSIEDFTPLVGSALESLDLTEAGLTSLYGILPTNGSLTMLELRFNSIIDLRPLSSQARLETLGLQGNPIDWALFPNGLASLATLQANGTGIEIASDLPLYLGATLTSLDISYQHTELSDLSALQAFQKLENLSFSGNSDIDWSSAPELPEVSWLGAHGTGLKQLAQLSPLGRKLRSTDLSWNKLENLDGLNDLVELTSQLNVAYNSISNISAIYRPLTNLTLGGNDVYDLNPLSVYKNATQGEIELWENPIRKIDDLFMGWRNLRINLERTELSCQEIAYVESYVDDELNLTWPSLDACYDDPDRDYVFGNADAFPLDPSESVDTDGDGTGDNADLDDDEDGTPDAQELLDGTDPKNPLSCLEGCFSFDIDRNGEAKALTDGLLFIRHLFGFTGDALATGAVGSDATRDRGEDISAFLADANSELDIDGDGSSQPLTDGLLLIRYLFGFSGDSLISGAIGSGAERETAEEVEAYIQERVPVQ